MAAVALVALTVYVVYRRRRQQAVWFTVADTAPEIKSSDTESAIRHPVNRKGSYSLDIRDGYIYDNLNGTSLHSGSFVAQRPSAVRAAAPARDGAEPATMLAKPIGAPVREPPGIFTENAGYEPVHF